MTRNNSIGNNKYGNRTCAGVSKLTALLLSLILAFAFTLTGCGDGKDMSADVSDGVTGIEYYHYDVKPFNKMCDELEALADGDDADAVIRKYDRLYDECVELETLYAVIYIMYSTDVTNDYYSKEQIYTYNKMNRCEDRLCEICSKITEGPCADAFREHVGDEAFKEFADYRAMTEREKKLIKKETELVDEYYDVIDEVENDTYKYRGKEWTLEMISGDEGNELAYSDYDGYNEIYEGLLKMANDKAGPIFLELVDLRTELAKCAGYDNYATYADEKEYCRDYTAADIDQLHKDVKKISKTYFDNYYNSYSDDGGKSLPQMSIKKLLTTLQDYSYEIDDLAGDSADQMIDEQLISIGDEKCRQDGAFTTFIYEANCPFISMTLDRHRDFLVLSHEFGHFVEYNNEVMDNILTGSDCIDLAEIASNGLMTLMINFYDDIYKVSADKARKDAIGELLENVIDGCIEDEFQREVYANPDMTLDEINKLYSETNAQYNPWVEGDPGYSWIFINHNFESPMYYISYTVSALAALQIWNQSNKDFDGAVKTWEKFIKEGSYNKTYLDIVGKCGLVKFTEKGAVRKICKPALKATSSELDFDYDFEY